MLKIDQLTRQQAIDLGNSKWYEDCDPKVAAWFQLHQRLLCMPFDKFHEYTEIFLGRPVWTHEFANPDALIDEYNGLTPRKSFEDIIVEAKKLFGDKMICIYIDPEDYHGRVV